MSKYCVSPEEENCEKMFSFWDKIIGARYILPSLKRCTTTKIGYGKNAQEKTELKSKKYRQITVGSDLTHIWPRPCPVVGALPKPLSVVSRSTNLRPIIAMINFSLTLQPNYL